MISLKDPFYSALPPKKRHLWALPEATDVNPNQTDNFLINPSFFTPSVTVQLLMLNLKLFFFFNLLYILLHIPSTFSQDLD